MVLIRGGSGTTPGQQFSIGIPPMPVNAQVPRPIGQPSSTEFARTHALATRGVIDYTIRIGEKLYDSVTTKLDKTRYDGTAQRLFPFMNLTS